MRSSVMWCVALVCAAGCSSASVQQPSSGSTSSSGASGSSSSSSTTTSSTGSSGSSASSSSSTSSASSSSSGSSASSSSGSSSSSSGSSGSSSGSTGAVGNTYYVSPSGSDSNDGLSSSTAWLTVDKVNASVFQAGDRVLFEGGQSFSGCFHFTSASVTNASPTQSLTVDAYGTGNFTLTASCSGSQAAAVDVDGLSGFTMRHATLVGNSGGAVYGVWLHDSGGTVASGITIDSCDIGGFYVPAGTQDFGGEIFITGIPTGLDNVKIINNSLHGLSGPSSPDDNGVAGFGNGKNITNVLYQGNTVYDIGGKSNGANGCEGNGIIANGVDGAVMQNNLGHDLGGNVTTCGGAAAFWGANVNNVIIQHNEAYRVQPISFTAGCDWDGYDLDIFTTNSVIQYNYSHDNYGVGFLLYGSKPWGPNTIRYNISENDGAGLAIGGDSNTTMDFAIYNNTIWANPPGSNPQNQLINVVGGIDPHGYVSNNILFQYANFYTQSRIVNSNGLNLPGIVYLNNLYYSPPPATPDLMMFNTGGTWYEGLGAWQDAGNDPMALSSDPLLASPGSAGTCGGYSPACLAGYKLQSGSPALDAGLDLTQPPYSQDVGTQDFFGNPLTPGHSNIGAYGGP